MNFLKKWMIVIVFLAIEFGLYAISASRIDLGIYALFWTATVVVLLLIKIVNPKGIKRSMRVRRGKVIELYPKVSFFEKHVKSKYRKHVACKFEDNHEIIQYVSIVGLNVLVINMWEYSSNRQL